MPVDPAGCRGQPGIRGTPIMMRSILGMMAGGDTGQRVLAEYPGLTRDDAAAAHPSPHDGEMASLGRPRQPASET